MKSRVSRELSSRTISAGSGIAAINDFTRITIRGPVSVELERTASEDKRALRRFDSLQICGTVLHAGARCLASLRGDAWERAIEMPALWDRVVLTSR
jgi:hypothetical protein